MSFDHQLAARQEQVEDLIEALETAEISEDSAEDAVESHNEQIERLKEQILGDEGDMQTKEIAPSS